MESLWNGFESRPNDPVLFARLREALEQEGDFSGLTKLYTQRAEAVGGEEAVFLHLTVAEVWSAQLGSEQDARQAYRKIIGLVDEFDATIRNQIIRSLEELCQAQGDWKNLAELIRTEAEQATPGPERARAWLKLGQLRDSKLDDIKGAARAYQSAAEDPGGQADQARKALRNLSLAHPDNVDVFDALGSVLRAGLPGEEDARELLSLLKRRLEHLDDRSDLSEKAQILLEMGEVASEALRDSEQGANYLESAHQAGANSRAVADALTRLIALTGDEASSLGLLRELLVELKDWEEAVAVGRREAQATSNSKVRADILMELARNYKEELNNLEQACLCYEEAYSHDHELETSIIETLQAALQNHPHHTEATRVLKIIYRGASNFEPLLTLLEEEETREKDDIKRASLLVEMARICAGPIGRPDRSLEHYETAAGLVGDDAAEILDGLLEMYRQGYYLERVKKLLHTICRRTQQWSMLIDLYELSLDGAASDEEQGAIHFELGKILEDEISDYERAMTHYQHAFKAAPHRAEYIEAGRDLFREMGNVEMVARLYDIQLQVIERPQDAARILYAKSRVLVDEVGDRARAIEALSRACGLDPEYQEAHTLLIELASSTKGKLALSTLEEAYTTADRPGEAALIYVTLGDAVRNTLENAASNQERNTQLTNANAFDLRACRLDPSHLILDRVAERLEEGLIAQEQWEDVIELLDQRATLEPEPEDRILLLQRMADIAYDHQSDPNTAARAYRTILNVDPSRAEVFPKLVTLLEKSQETETLTTLYQWALESADWVNPRTHPDERATLLLSFAQLQHTQNERAAQHELMTQLSELRPNHDAVRDYFQSHANTEEGAIALFRVLEYGLSHLPDPDLRAGRRVELAELALNTLSDPELAIDQHTAIIDMPGTSLEHINQARTHLRALYRDLKQFEPLINMIEDELVDTNDTGSVRCLTELADIHQHTLHNFGAAQHALFRLISLQPEIPELQLRLADVYHLQNAYIEEAGVLEQLLDLAENDPDNFKIVQSGDDPLKRSDIMMRRANLLVDIDREEEAAKHYTELLKHEQHRATALEHLQALLIQLRDYERLMLVLEDQAEHARDRSDRIQFIARMAMLAEQELNDPQRAIALWKRVLEIKQRDPMALQALEELYEAGKSWDDVIETCKTRLLLLTDPQDRMRLYRKMSRIHRQNAQYEEAKVVLYELIGEVPEDILARQELYEIYLSEENWNKLITINEELLRYEDEPERRHELLREQSTIAEDHLADAPAAILVLERLTEEFPTDTESLTRLHELHVDQNHWAKAADVQELRIALTHDDNDRIKLLMALSTIHHTHLRDPETAAAVLKRVLEVHDTHREALLLLEKLHIELEDHAALAETRLQLLAITEDSDEELDQLRKLANVFEQGLGKFEEAFRCLAVIHEKHPNDDEHQHEMFRIAEDYNLWPLYLDVLADDVEKTNSLEQQIALMTQMAELIEQRTDAPDDAFGIYSEIFLAQPTLGEAMAQMERLATEHVPNRWPDILAHYESLVDTTEDLEEVIHLFWRISDRQLNAMGTPQGAFATLKRALDMGLDEDQTLERFHTVAEAGKLWPDLVTIYDQLWQDNEGIPKVQIDLLTQTAELALKHLDDASIALDRYTRAFQLNPWNDDVRNRLHTLVSEQESWPLLLDLYESVIDACHHEDKPAGQVQFLLHIASVHEHDRGDVDLAFDALLRAFHVASANIEVRTQLEQTGQLADRLGEVALAYRDTAAASPHEVALIFLLAAARLLAGPLDIVEEAVDVLREAMELDPDNAETQEHLELLLRDRGDIEALVGLYIHRAERTLDRQQRFDAYLQVANLMAESEDPERAVEYYRRALRLEPKELSIFESLVALHDRLEQPEHTARTLEQIIEVFPDDLERIEHSYDRLGTIYAASGRPTRAIESLKLLMDLRPGRLDVIDRLEVIMRETDRLDDLLRFLDTRIIGLDTLIAEINTSTDATDRRLLDHEGESLRVESLRARQRTHLRTMVDLATGPLANPRKAIDVLCNLIERDPENVEAIEHLAELYASLGRWQDHIDTLQLRLSQSDSRETRALLLRQIADVQEDQLHQPSKAARTLGELVQEYPDDGPALADLARLHARQEQWDQAIERYDQACTIADEAALPPSLRAELFCLAANILENQFDQPGEALARYELALEVEPESETARQAIIRHLVDHPDRWEQRTKLLQDEHDRTYDATARADLGWEIGVIWRTHDRPDDAAAAFRGALQENPEHLKSMRDLGDLAIHTESWEVAREIYTELLSGNLSRMAMETHKIDDARLLPHESNEDPAYVTYTARLATSLDHLGDTASAVERYTQALRVRSNNLVALLGLGRIAFDEERTDEAARHLTKIIHNHTDALSPEEHATTLFQMATLRHNQGQHKTALTNLDKALEFTPENTKLHRLALTITEILGDKGSGFYARALEHLEHLINVAEPDEKLELLLRKGRLCHTHLDDPDTALKAYTEARQLNPTNVALLQTTLDLHIEREQWEEADEISKTLIQIDQDNLAEQPDIGEDTAWRDQAIHHLLSRGDVLHKGMGDTDNAIQVYERALQLNPDDLDPLDRIALMLGRQGQFDTLLSLYNAQAIRLSNGNRKQHAAILHRLGTLLKDQLGALPQALQVHCQIRDLQPNDTTAHEAILALLLEGDREQFQPKIAMISLQELLILEGLSEERLRQMLAFYRMCDHEDGSRILLKMLDICRHLSRDEQQALRQIPNPINALKEGDLAAQAHTLHVRPPQTRGPVAELMSFVVEQLTGAVYQSVMEFDVSSSDLISDQKGVNVANTFRDLRGILGLDDVELYLKKGGFKGIKIVMARPAAIIIGEDVYRGLFNSEQRFVLGRALELTRPEYILSEALPPFEFLTLFEALFEHASPGTKDRFQADESMSAMLAEWHEKLDDSLSPEMEVHLRALIASIHKAYPDRPSAPGWRRFARSSALRTGLHLANDVQVALKRLMREDNRIQVPTIRNSNDLAQAMELSRDIHEMVLYILSEDFIAARMMFLNGIAGDPVHEQRIEIWPSFEPAEVKVPVTAPELQQLLSDENDPDLNDDEDYLETSGMIEELLSHNHLEAQKPKNHTENAEDPAPEEHPPPPPALPEHDEIASVEILSISELDVVAIEEATTPGLEGLQALNTPQHEEATPAAILEDPPKDTPPQNHDASTPTEEAPSAEDSNTEAPESTETEQESPQEEEPKAEQQEETTTHEDEEEITNTTNIPPEPEEAEEATPKAPEDALEIFDFDDDEDEENNDAEFMFDDDDDDDEFGEPPKPEAAETQTAPDTPSDAVEWVDSAETEALMIDDDDIEAIEN